MRNNERKIRTLQEKRIKRTVPLGLPDIRRSLKFPLRLHSRIRKEFYKLRFSKVYLLSGTRNGESHKFTILYIGGETNKHYLSHLAFDGACIEEKLGPLWIWQVFGLIIQLRKICAFVVIEGNYPILKSVPVKNAFYIPDWVNGEVDLDEKLENPKKQSRTVFSNIKRLKKNGLTYEITTDERQFKSFYHKMYAPYILNRFADTACIREIEVLRRDFRKGELLLVKKDEDAIAGGILKYNANGQIDLTRMGILDGNIDYVKLGALSAVYYYVFSYAREKGYRKADVGGSRPFLNDGVLNYKRNNWDMRITDYYRRGMLLKPLTLNRGAKKFLLDNPFVAIIGNRPIGIVFESCDESGSPESCLWNQRKREIRGLSGIVYYSVESKQDAMEPALPNYDLYRRAQSYE